MSLRDYLASWRRPLTFAAFAWDDPLPGVVDLVVTTYRRAVRRLHRANGAAQSDAEQEGAAPPANVSGNLWDNAVAPRRQIVGSAGSPAEATSRLRARLDAIKRSSINVHALRHAASDMAGK
jgi:hypothetical protein